MSTFLQLLIAGLTVGAIYATIAIGYATIYSATGVISFTLGSQAMVCGYVAYVWLAGWPFGLAAVVAVAVGALGSLLLWLAVFKPIFTREGAMPTVIASFAASIAVQEVVRIISTADVRAASNPFGQGVHHFGAVVLTNEAIGTLSVVAIIMGGILVLFRSRWALFARALFQDPMMARGLGVPDRSVVTVIFLLSGATTAAAGLLLAPLTGLSPFSGVYVALVGFVGATLGGMTGVAAAACGAILLGVCQSLFAGYASANYTDALIFGMLAVVLIVRPAGLLTRGTEVRV